MFKVGDKVKVINLNKLSEIFEEEVYDDRGNVVDFVGTVVENNVDHPLDFDILVEFEDIDSFYFYNEEVKLVQ